MSNINTMQPKEPVSLMSAEEVQSILQSLNLDMHQQNDIYEAFEKVISYINNNEPATLASPKKRNLVEDSIFIKEGEYYYKVKFGDILYIRSEHVYVTIQTEEKKFIVRCTMQQLISKLNDKRFFRIHRSYAVNVDKIEKINNIYVVIKDEQLPLSKSNRDELLSLLNVA